MDGFVIYIHVHCIEYAYKTDLHFYQGLVNCVGYGQAIDLRLKNLSFLRVITAKSKSNGVTNTLIQNGW